MLFLAFIAGITLLSVVSDTWAAPITVTPSISSHPITRAEMERFSVQIDSFAQLIATHWQFDHFESIISGTYKEIANQFQNHVQITVQSPARQHAFQNSQKPASTIQPALPSLDIMDLEVLKSQIFAAIQAHTEGNLPVAWDKFGDKLGRQAIEGFVKQILTNHCKDYDNEKDLQKVSSVCLAEKADQLSAELDRYVSRHLTDIFDALDKHVLPDMLMHTTNDLKNVLDYFNSAFTGQEFVLDVTPWQSQQQEQVPLTDRLLQLATQPQATAQEDHHPTDFFSHYASLARS
ncbi:uncharacterized protein BYT42DRAFT_572812 [Radiomyces spectabilis]|uniref:uncharacterized protein n=1 Tax=Radiomyces spectabilis TaxID=64574 RepID=UPI00221FAC1C|nr:uncharacterized protein BYT42DRAFT_572812 [Radiomyces spectabilis]KAI8375928.1 hypothetical protein BYT42DRAFT_572812 [Radiomyces spectabilis]